MRYLILIYSNPASRAAWETLSDDQRMDFGRAHVAFRRELAAAGVLVVSEGLDDIATAKRIGVHDGRTLTTDGPFAEVKEHLAGFYLIECDGIDQAVALASGLPDTANDAVEVRPVFDLSRVGL